MNKLIFISNSLIDIETVKHFAEKNNYSLEYYSPDEWKNLQNKKPIDVKPTPIDNDNNVLDKSASFGVQKTMDELKKEAIKTALLKSRGNASKAAEVLQIGRATLYRKIKDLGFNLNSIRKNINEDYPSSEVSVKKAG